MVASRDVLDQENKLLVDLENVASNKSGGEDWKAFFSEWRRINEGLINESSDANFNKRLDEEIKRLQKMRNAISGDRSAGGQFWRQMLFLDITAAKALKI